MALFVGKKFCFSSIERNQELRTLVTSNGGQVVEDTKSHEEDVLHVVDSFDVTSVCSDESFLRF